MKKIASKKRPLRKLAFEIPLYTGDVITHVSHSDIRTVAASGHEMLQWRLLT